MITRAQAEALLTLAESLEACERLNVHVGAWMAQGLGLIDISLKGKDEFDTELSGQTVRLFVTDRIDQ